jgi:uncharacterized protein DUF4333
MWMSTVDVQLVIGEIMLLAVRAVLTGAVCAAAVTITGCSVSVEPKTDEVPTLKQETVETGIADALEKAVGQRPDSVECPDPVPAKEGETFRCELSAGSTRYGLTGTITSLSDGKAQYDVKVDEKPVA